MTESLSPDQIFIRKLKEIVLANLNKEDFGAEELARESGMSHSGLYRKLNKATNKTISQFIREVRLEEALAILSKESLSAAEVSYKVGFNSPAYFNTCFHEYFGYPPGRVKKNHNDSNEENIIKDEQTAGLSEKTQSGSYTTFIKRVIVIALAVFFPLVAVYRVFLRPDASISPGSSKDRISIVVMPFKNMTSETVWDFWEEGIQVNIINTLSELNEFVEVRQTESVKSLLQTIKISDYASITPQLAGRISKKLKTDYFIYGNIQKAGSRIRLSVQLTDSKSGIVLKPFEIDGPAREDIILPISDTLRRKLTDFLIISLLKKELSPDFKTYEYTNSPEVYRYFINGNNAVMKGDPATAVDLYMKALVIDSNFLVPAIFASSNYPALGLYEDAKKWCLKAYAERDRMPLRVKIMADWAYSNLFESPREALKYLKQDLEFDDQMPIVYWLIGNTYSALFEYDKAIPYFEKSLSLYRKWDAQPAYGNYTSLGYAYHKTGKYGKEKRLYRHAGKQYPENDNLLFRQAVLALSTGHYSKADKFINEYVSVQSEKSESEANILTGKAMIYRDAGILDKAEDYFREALSIEPGNPLLMNSLAYFLIESERDINEGLRIAETCLEIIPDNYEFMHSRGWGLYKQDRYQEAFETLRKSWELRMKNAVYDHESFVHLGEAKKSIIK